MWANLFSSENRAPSLSLTTGGAKAKITPFWFAVDKTEEDVVCVWDGTEAQRQFTP